MEDATQHYSPESFREKVARHAWAIGEKVLLDAFVLAAVKADKKIPTKYKAMVIAALGYLILPADAIPDLTPIAGFTDDAGALALTVSMLTKQITPEHRAWARERVMRLFAKKTKAVDEAGLPPIEED
jgi:uncharacterized membrane protein YkvA (DUF1232 family)